MEVILTEKKERACLPEASIRHDGLQRRGRERCPLYGSVPQYTKVERLQRHRKASSTDGRTDCTYTRPEVREWWNFHCRLQTLERRALQEEEEEETIHDNAGDTHSAQRGIPDRLDGRSMLSENKEKQKIGICCPHVHTAAAVPLVFSFSCG